MIDIQRLVVSLYLAVIATSLTGTLAQAAKEWWSNGS